MRFVHAREGVAKWSGFAEGGAERSSLWLTPSRAIARRYKEEQITSVVSKVGTVIACSLLFALSIVQVSERKSTGPSCAVFCPNKTPKRPHSAARVVSDASRVATPLYPPSLTLVWQLIKYGKAESSISPSTIPRNTSLEMGIPAVAVIVFSDGKEFYDPSVMRILFQYRVGRPGTLAPYPRPFR